jgi:hypothetical protein
MAPLSGLTYANTNRIYNKWLISIPAKEAINVLKHGLISTSSRSSGTIVSITASPDTAPTESSMALRIVLFLRFGTNDAARSVFGARMQRK